MTSCNGAPLPVVVLSFSDSETFFGIRKIEFLDDVLSLNADHTYTTAGHHRDTYADGSVSIKSEVDTGTYSISGGSVSMISTIDDPAHRDSLSIVVNENTVTVSDKGITCVWSRSLAIVRAVGVGWGVVRSNGTHRDRTMAAFSRSISAPQSDMERGNPSSGPTALNAPRQAIAPDPGSGNWRGKSKRSRR